VLGLLTFGEMSGYDLVKLAERSINHFWAPAKSRVYTELKRLAAGGLASERRIEQARRPAKTVYAITEEGRDALRRWLLESDVRPDPIKSVATLRVFFGGLVGPEPVAHQIRELRRAAQATLEELRATEEEIRGDERLFYPYLTLLAGLAHYEAEIRWADAALAALVDKEER
jgi:PadR family transcriptional regulator AphA